MVSNHSQSKWDYLSPKRLQFVPDLLVVRIKSDVVANMGPVALGAASFGKALKLPQAVEEPLNALVRNGKIKQMTPVFAPMPRVQNLMRAGAAAARISLASSVLETKDHDLRGINLLRLSKGTDGGRVEKNLRATRGVEYVHRVPARWAAAAAPKAISNDPMVNRQWGLRAIRWFDPGLNPNAANVGVAVLDTGIDLSHPDLRTIGAKYTHDGASAEDIIGHGTHVSGIIAADFNNNVGIAGVCRCALHVWKIFGDTPASDGNYYVDELMYQRALNDARNSGARTMNLSIGGTQSSRTEQLLFGRLINAGVTVVAAMGNEYQEGNPTEYPANYPGVIAVGASNETDQRAPFSNTGANITLCAPGTNILSCLPMKPSAYRTQTQYAAWSGTSMATPHVTAATALLIAKKSGTTSAAAAKVLRKTASKMKGKPNEIGGGLLNLARALS
jgi:subtilisin family serine protease